jgi:hypothetical protein
VTRKAAGREEASNGFLNLRLTVKPDTRHSTFTIRSEKMLRPPNTTVDATVELMKPDLTLEMEGILQSLEWGNALERMEFDKTYNVRTICGQPPLLWASENGCVKMAKLLIDNGIDVATKNNAKQRAPLITASENGHAGVVQPLIATGKADTNMPQDNPPITILLVGPTGSGKSTFVKWIIGDPNVKTGGPGEAKPCRFLSQGFRSIQLLRPSADYDKAPTTVKITTLCLGAGTTSLSTLRGYMTCQRGTSHHLRGSGQG